VEEGNQIRNWRKVTQLMIIYIIRSAW